jgi:hypothetical protein
VTFSWESWDEVVKNRSKGYASDTDCLLNAAADVAHALERAEKNRKSNRKRLVIFDLD